MERIDLSTLTGRQLQQHAARAQNDHFQCARFENRIGMSAALAEYYRVRVEMADRRVAQLRIDEAPLNDLAAADHDQAMATAQMNYWHDVATGQRAVAV